jgi:hypothetical protein
MEMVTDLHVLRCRILLAGDANQEATPTADQTCFFHPLQMIPMTSLYLTDQHHQIQGHRK